MIRNTITNDDEKYNWKRWWEIQSQIMMRNEFANDDEKYNGKGWWEIQLKWWQEIQLLALRIEGAQLISNLFTGSPTSNYTPPETLDWNSKSQE